MLLLSVLFFAGASQLIKKSSSHRPATMFLLTEPQAVCPQSFLLSLLLQTGTTSTALGLETLRVKLNSMLCLCLFIPLGSEV